MNEPTIICPKCKTEIKLTEALAAPVLAAARLSYSSELAVEIAKATAKAEGSARARFKDELLHANQEIDRVYRESVAKDEKLSSAQKAQVDFERQSRELADAKREHDLSVERAIQAGLGGVREEARKSAEEASRLRVMEKEETIGAMSRQIDDLKRRAEQGSQQLQGEVQELLLESALRAAFPRDTIAPVGKGEFGGDIIQDVEDGGRILWESKRTKSWSRPWLSKLRDDQRASKADVAVLVTSALPQGVVSFENIEGVWVVSPGVAVPLAMVLTVGMREVASARRAGEGLETKAGQAYGYLTGPRFRQRVGAVIEAFTSMKEDLDKERKSITKQWSKRESQIERAMQSTVGMYGDLQGIAGNALQEIEGATLLEQKELT